MFKIFSSQFVATNFKKYCQGLLSKFNNWQKNLREKRTSVIGLFFIIILCLTHLYLTSDTFFIDDSGSIRTTIEGYGDIPFHLTQITKFAYEPSFNLDETIFAGEKIHYPFLINLISGLLLRHTGWLTFSVMFPIYFLTIANLILIASIYNKLFRNLLLTAIAAWIFMLGSGMGGFSYISQAISGHYPLSQINGDILNKKVPTITYWEANYPDQNIDFGAPLSLVLIHQRAFILGLFGFLLILFLLIKKESDSQPKWKYFLGISIVLGALPMMHTHSFVAAATAVAIYGIIHFFHKNWTKAIKVFYSLIGGIILALPQVWYLVGTKSIFTEKSEFSKFRLGWMIESTIGSVRFPVDREPIFFSFAHLNFLWINFGVILLALLLGAFIFAIWNRKISGHKKMPLMFLASSVFLFMAVQLIQFQPWDYDNNKLLVYFQFFAVPFTLWLTINLLTKHRTLKIITVIVYFLFATLTGFIDIAPRLAVSKNNLPVIFDISAQNLASYIRTQIPEENILTSATHLNPVSSLAGRPVIVAFPGWLWTRGIDYLEREDDIKNFYRDPQSHTDILRKYSLSYVLIDSMAINDYKASKYTFNQLFYKIFEDGNLALYQVNK